MTILINSPHEDQSIKSITSLKEYLQKNQKFNPNDPVFLIITTEKPLIKKNDYIPRIIPLPHKLSSTGSKSILLITKDPSTVFRSELSKNPKTQELIKEIYSLKKLKSISRNSKRLKNIFNEFDLILADHRINHFLPDILGTMFYVKHKKVPFTVQLAKPSIIKSIKSKSKLNQINKHKNHDSKVIKLEKCDSNYVLKQLKSIVKNSFFIPNENGNCLSVKIGYLSFTDKKLIENIDATLEYLCTSKFKPVGGLINGLKNIKSLNIKTSESIALPIINTAN
ncbi:Utp30p [Ascoidea rubescens DSM 1968]|uniref:Ribosomal protein L1 n=1 Tax=Ascoidea rubescens DSM 1968 TaxID=1344418 RepID=A0A1D2VIQ6_9ASCO|nr:ribosomal protein L1 [Ascoidea rubescens DSM 1968]ODV61509.1 ribosomal protein L1 [Ascoidea rubescens DSM 1968]